MDYTLNINKHICIGICILIICTLNSLDTNTLNENILCRYIYFQS